MPAMNKGLSVYFALSFVRWLNTPFEKWPEYELGLIDDKGKILRKPENPEEKKHINVFSTLVRKLKIVLGKIPGGSSRLASALTTVALLKESYDFDENIVVAELEKIFKEDHVDTTKLNNPNEYVFVDTIYNEIKNRRMFTVQIENSSTVQVGKHSLLKIETKEDKFYI